MKILDAKGELCPKPLIMAKKALTEMSEGEMLHIEVDNETSAGNLMVYLSDQKARPSMSQSDKIFTIKATKSTEFDVDSDAGQYCSPQLKTNETYVVQLISDKMGRGDDNLGDILMRAFINSLGEQEKLPSHIVMYNSAVKLATYASEVSPALRTLENLGVKVVVCGTCADFFALKEDLAVGEISNMYTITEILANTGHVVTP